MCISLEAYLFLHTNPESCAQTKMQITVGALIRLFFKDNIELLVIPKTKDETSYTPGKNT